MLVILIAGLAGRVADEVTDGEAEKRMLGVFVSIGVEGGVRSVVIGERVSVGTAWGAGTGNGVGDEAQAVIQIQIKIKTRFMRLSIPCGTGYQKLC